MNHKRFIELLHLSFVGELDDDERQLLERHLKTCEECQGEFAELKKFHALVSPQKTIQPSEELLQEVRQELRVALRFERSRSSVWSSLSERLSFFVSPQFRVALGGLAVLAVGVLIGYVAFAPSFQQDFPAVMPSVERVASMRGETRIANVQFVNSDPQNGEVEFSFEAVTPIRMKGSLQDHAVQKVLAQALLNEQNPGTRLRTVRTMVSQVESTKTLDKDIKSAFIQALKSDINPAVRKEALRTLQKFPMDNDVKQAFLFVLQHDGNPAMRIEVINSMEKALTIDGKVDQDILNAIKEKMQSDQNNYIRIRARNVYEEVKQQ